MLASAAEAEAKCGPMGLFEDVFASTRWRCWSMRLRCRHDVFGGEERTQFEITDCQKVDYAGSGRVKAREVGGALLGSRVSALGA